MKKLFLILFILFVAVNSGSSQSFHRNASGRGPGSMAKAKRKQEANDQKLNKDYKNFVKASQKRSVDIQSPEVRARMKHNKKENAVRDKAKKKMIRSGSKTAGKKYK